MLPWLTNRGGKDGELFFIPARFWPVGLLVIGAILMFVH
jgi:hypothetical protein